MSSRCALCGEPIGADEQHVCADAMTANVDPNQPAPPPLAIPTTDETDPLLGTTLADRYELLSRISRGGMGVVYKARHKLLNSTVAVKVLLKKEIDIDQKRFLQEAQLASKLAHPNIVYISDYGLLPDGRPYLVMEFIEGPTLGRVLARSENGRIDILRACKIASQIARGMQIVHDNGIVHRDLKPENIFVLNSGGKTSEGAAGSTGAAAGAQGGQDFVKIVDFGVAKDTRAAHGPDSSPADPSARPSAHAAELRAQKASESLDETNKSSRADGVDATGGDTGGQQGLTRVGDSIGTPRYMAPEQVDGYSIDARADQYALGCILHQMIGGQAPFSAPTSMALLSMHLFEPPKSLRERYPELKVPEAISAIVLRMLAKNKNDRFPSMSAVAAALDVEIERLSILRGEKVAISSGLAAMLGGRQGTHIIIRGVRLSRAAILGASLALFGVILLAGALVARQLSTGSQALKPGELAELEAQARRVLSTDVLPSQQVLDLRVTAMKGLAQTHDGTYLEPLAEPLTEAQPVIQSRAAEALGILGDRRAVRPLQEILTKSTVPQVQIAAAQALVQLHEPQGQKFLETTLASGSEEARLRSALQLCSQGHGTAQQLLQSAVEKNRIPESQRLHVLTCLTQLGSDAARKQLQEQMRSRTGQEALLAAAKLAQLGHEDGRAFLRERILTPGADQLVAARFLSAPDEPQVAELFRQVLRDPKVANSAKVLAAEGLGLSGQLIDARILGQQLQNPSERAATLAAAASIVLLSRNQPSTLSDQSLAWAKTALTDDEWSVRESAVEVLGDSPAADAVPLLTKLLGDSHPAVRRSAARALRRRHDEKALLALGTSLRDSDSSVRQESLKALIEISHAVPQDGRLRQSLQENANAWVKDLTATGSESEQTLARSLLFQLGDESQLERLTQLVKSRNEEVRSLVIEQLGREVTVLLAMLEDTVFSVRFAAARKLAEAGDQRAIPVLKEALTTSTAEALTALVLLRRLGAEASIPEGLLHKLIEGNVSQRLSVLDSFSAVTADQRLVLLKRLARDLDSKVRRRTAEVAAALPSEAGIRPGLPILQLLVNDSDAAVRARAQALLAPLLEKATESAPSPPLGKTAQDAPKPMPKEPKSEPSTATTTPTPGEKAKPEAEATAVKSSERAEDGSGSLVIETAPIVQFQIDHGRWQTASKQPITLSTGSHEIVALSGTQQIELKDGQTVTVKIPESQAEKLTQSGLDAYEKKDLRKAQKLLEKAGSLCSKERKHPQPCSDLAVEINFHLGQIHEASERFAEAVTAYQKVVQSGTPTRGQKDRRPEAQKAMAELLPNLGQVVIPKQVKNHCQEVTLYMLPGSHMIEIEGNSQMVKVKAKETVRLGSCQ